MLGRDGYNLTCNVFGSENLNSTITYQWTKNNSTHTHVQVGTDSSTLSFPSLRLSDAGEYTCQVNVSSSYLNKDVTALDFHSIATQSELFSYIYSYVHDLVMHDCDWYYAVPNVSNVILSVPSLKEPVSL